MTAVTITIPIKRGLKALELSLMSYQDAGYNYYPD